MHTDIYAPLSSYENMFQKLTATGLLVHVSELDVSVNNNQNLDRNLNLTTLSPAFEAEQRQRYKDLVFLYRKHTPAAQRWGITLWDMMDHTSWLNQYRPEWPCLYDKNADKKPAFLGFVEGLKKPL